MIDIKYENRTECRANVLFGKNIGLDVLPVDRIIIIIWSIKQQYDNKSSKYQPQIHATPYY